MAIENVKLLDESKTLARGNRKNERTQRNRGGDKQAENSENLKINRMARYKEVPRPRSRSGLPSPSGR